MNFNVSKQKLKIYFFIFFFTVIKLGYCFDRGIAVTQITELSHNSAKVGEYYAIIIGIDNYKDPKIADLNTAVHDASEISKIFKSRYGFSEITFLINEDASRYNIDRLFRKKIAKLNSDDNLLIYFSGHGDIDRQLGGGWWIPVDAKAGIPSTYIDNTLIQKYIKSFQAKHVLLISDSCYSGTLFGETRNVSPIITNQFYMDLYNVKSRWGMTSGNITPVSDIGTNGHSVFAYQLIKLLKINTKPYITPREIYTKIGPIIRNNSDQMPVCSPIINTGDQGGEFVFILKTVSDNENINRKLKKNLSLYIETQPSNANIYINNKYMGTSPINLKDPNSGEINIEIKKKEYKTIIKTINAFSEKSPSQHLVFNLERNTKKKGLLFVKTNPLNANIRILNIRPVFYQGISLHPGKYRLEVKKNGYKKYDKWLSITEGQNIFEINLNKISYYKKDILQNFNIDNTTQKKKKLINITKNYYKNEILHLFEKDFHNNNTLLYSYRVLLNYLESLSEDQYNHDIALFLGAYYKEIVLDESKIFRDLSFLDNSIFYYTIRSGRYNQNWKFYKYDLPNKSSTFIYSDEGKMFFLNKEEIFVLKNNKPYIYNLKLKEKKYLGFTIYKEPVDVVMSPNKEYISYSYTINGFSQLFLYSLLDYTITKIYRNKIKGAVHYSDPFFSYDSNFLYYRKNDHGKEYDQLLEYNLKSGDYKVLFSEKNFAYNDYLSDNKYFIYSTYDDNYKKKIKIFDSKTKQFVENISLDSSDDNYIRLNKKKDTIFFHRKIFGYSAIWANTIGKEKNSIPVTFVEVEDFWIKFYNVSPNGNYLIYSSKHSSGKESLYFLDITKKNTNEISANCKLKLKQLINKEEAKSVVYDFLYEAIVKKNNYKGQIYISNTAKANIFESLKSKQSWYHYLKNLGYYDDYTNCSTLLDGNLTIKSINGGFSNGNAFFQANINYDVPQKVAGNERIDFELKKVNNNWKITAIYKTN